MKITTIIIAIVLLMVGWMAGQAGAEEMPFTVEGVPWQEYQYRIDPVPRPEPSCAEKWKAYDKWRSSSKSPICDKLTKGQPQWDCLNKRERELRPSCSRPDGPEPESGADYTLTSPPTIAKGSLDRQYKLKSVPECPWEWKSTLDLDGTSEWEPFSVLESDEVEWSPKQYYGSLGRDYTRRGRTVKKTRVWLKRQVCNQEEN